MSVPEVLAKIMDNLEKFKKEVNQLNVSRANQNRSETEPFATSFNIVT